MIVKPPQWNVSPAFIAPEWRWAWRGLTAHWPMWEGGGTRLMDIGGGGNHGTFESTPTWSTSDRGVSLSFDGTDRVDMGDVLDVGSGDFTVLGWVKKATGGEAGFFIWKGPNPGWNVYLDGSAMRVELDDGPNNIKITRGTLNDTTLHQVGFTVKRSSNICKVYIDGVQAGTDGDISSVTGSLDTASFLAIGADSGGAFPLVGLIDDMRMWDRVLTESEIGRLYLDPFGPIRMDLGAALFVPPVCPPGTNKRRGSYPQFAPMTLSPCPDGIID